MHAASQQIRRDRHSEGSSLELAVSQSNTHLRLRLPCRATFPRDCRGALRPSSCRLRTSFRDRGRSRRLRAFRPSGRNCRWRGFGPCGSWCRLWSLRAWSRSGSGRGRCRGRSCSLVGLSSLFPLSFCAQTRHGRNDNSMNTKDETLIPIPVACKGKRVWS